MFELLLLLRSCLMITCLMSYMYALWYRDYCTWYMLILMQDRSFIQFLLLQFLHEYSQQQFLIFVVYVCLLVNISMLVWQNIIYICVCLCYTFCKYAYFCIHIHNYTYMYIIIYVYVMYICHIMPSNFTKYLNTRLAEGGGTLIASGLELGLQVLEQRRLGRGPWAAAIQLKRSFYWGIYGRNDN